MNEIEKMYKNAGIKPTKNWQSCLNCKLKTETRYDEWGKEYLTCNRLEMPEECSNAKEYYPLFTAEKQLLLLQWLLDKTDIYVHRNKTDFTYSISSGSFAVNKYKDFKESIAEFINGIWQDITERELVEIKRILEW